MDEPKCCIMYYKAHQIVNNWITFVKTKTSFITIYGLNHLYVS